MTAGDGNGWTDDPGTLLRVGRGFRLADVDPEATPGYEGSKKDGRTDLAAGAQRLGALQERLFAQSRDDPCAPAVLLVLQGMDSAGKGGVVRHVVGAADPQGVRLVAFKAPTPAELAHDFLWRVEREVPPAGYVGVFDRSHYEDVLIGRVRGLAPADEIERRYGAITAFEDRLVERGVHLVKVMLHISADEQKRRLGRRLARPDKHWKYHPEDVDERLLWPRYMDAFQTALERTSTVRAPWFVVPANAKWYARLAVQALLVGTLAAVDPRWPAATFDVEAERARLEAT
ncbi:PPK2 family polyphosphate kinase [Isoptericola sp. BMS4]|uniref:PPK2 family polyphosphate kinase n=1 Tax=Isoptericola sp. BMS4 TaxID=2527875 RepID=UPI001424A26A|nr:PPK2 family polyphosphate kinase [Isoptericola sp. BMS4]